MKRSAINQIYQEAKACFVSHGWTLPPDPRWDITDFGLGDFDHYGLVLINLAEEPEYCEKLMYARKGQTTPSHTHAQKKEDIICRTGSLSFELWAGPPNETEPGTRFDIQVNGKMRPQASGETLTIGAGERITLIPGIYHAFWPESDGCIIGEVSTANDDAHDNFFADPNIGRFPGIEEDEPPMIRLISED
ncbi:D-lyxose/D-mannose family sugar isomerase [Puniceicoccus vermicola]|uniref:D-lyxose ketol-isomerase n=1 Tax=Puniceicoccus vermicola TaxID=388746 RepID=A0A7X1E7K7_9BACT|nr:D-lyxose/D-mannose family sugar isomerase [Puniceicoccus vermicola]MBC2603847.1 D-lyxose/D-mannose family sugar isomerase [Puniceicoccus vermicola]